MLNKNWSDSNEESIVLKLYEGAWTDEQVTHLLRRCIFGVTKQDLKHFSSLSMTQCVTELLSLDSIETTPEPPVNNYNDNNFTDPDVPINESWVNTLKYSPNSYDRRINSYKSWWIGLMINQNSTIREKMVFFWHNHFATETRNTEKAIECYHYNQTLRKNALGNFKAFVKEITLQPQMLTYLNGASNTKQAPDENYGRELQELFTVGKGPGSNYTQGDVEAASRVLTGFSIDYNNYTGTFFPYKHDTDDKKFSAFYKNKIIKGKTGPEGKEELDDMLDMICQQEEVSKFLCRKLYRFFVYHDIDANIETQVITPLATIFRNNNYDIKPVLKALFTSDHFYLPTNKGCIIKSPIEFAVGLCREFNLQSSVVDNNVTKYNFWYYILGISAQLQQSVGNPPNVAGWPAYYQTPQFDRMWINSDSLPRRNKFSVSMVTSGIRANGNAMLIDPIAFAANLSKPEDPDQLISESVQLLFMVDLDDETKKNIKSSIILAGLEANVSDHYWTQAWLNLKEKPDDIGNKNDVITKLRNFYKYLMTLPHYQLC